jgi:hypothetical protein
MFQKNNFSHQNVKIKLNSALLHLSDIFIRFDSTNQSKSYFLIRYKYNLIILIYFQLE